MNHGLSMASSFIPKWNIPPMDTRFLKTLSRLPTIMTEQIIKAYYPLPRFPPISFSRHCELSCLHCQGYYLGSMTHLTNPSDLYRFAHALSKRGGTGFLASGGFTEQGTLLYLEKMIPTLKRIKQTTSLLVALHSGFIDEQMALKLKKTGIDVVCPLVLGDGDTITEIMGLSATPQDYAQTLQNLYKAGLAISPHICAGIYWGKLQGEKKALSLIKDSCIPETVVITTLCPTRGTPMESSPCLSSDHLKNVIKWAQALFPGVELALGCMRPRQRSLEIMALTAGVTRIANPSKSFLAHAQKKGYTVRTYASCCGIPLSHEEGTQDRPINVQ